MVDTLFSKLPHLKFSFSEKATKICRIFLMVLTFTKYVYKVNVKTMRKIAQIFVAFSEKQNFNREMNARSKNLICMPNLKF